MKTKLIILNVFAIVLLMVSTTTAVPQVHSSQIMSVLNNKEQSKVVFDDGICIFPDIIIGKLTEIDSKGIISWLLNLIMSIIEFITNLIEIISAIISLGELIINLINLITTLFEVIMQIIEWIQGVINPNVFRISN